MARFTRVNAVIENLLEFHPKIQKTEIILMAV